MGGLFLISIYILAIVVLLGILSAMPEVLEQVQAYTIFEFQVANYPHGHDNATFTIHDYANDDVYTWFEADDERRSQLSGAHDARHDDIITELEADTDPMYTFATFFVIDRTLEPGTPVMMCVSFDNNEICEEEAIADYEHFYNSAMLEVDMNTTNTQH